jgi:hypothetical protein
MSASGFLKKRKGARAEMKQPLTSYLQVLATLYADADALRLPLDEADYNKMEVVIAVIEAEIEREGALIADDGTVYLPEGSAS